MLRVSTVSTLDCLSAYSFIISELHYGKSIVSYLLTISLYNGPSRTLRSNPRNFVLSKKFVVFFFSCFFFLLFFVCLFFVCLFFCFCFFVFCFLFVCFCFFVCLFFLWTGYTPLVRRETTVVTNCLFSYTPRPFWKGVHTKKMSYKIGCGPSKDLDQPVNPHIPIRVCAVCLKTLRVFGYTKCPAKTLIRLRGCATISFYWVYMQSYRKYCAPTY